ncbi:ATP-binding protein [Rubrolithibacter danxiaensis]|uniref:ATP-binding protein n=1 Tax=Rubrolithibacter danxiaensis TaxID=3390805 RepID=UPI003BF8E644
MKLSLVLILSFLVSGLKAQEHSLEKIWESDSLAVPESVLHHAKTGILYVSLIDGKADEKDGKGGIAKLDANGKIISSDWVKGLNAPKGLGIYKNKLYAADIDEVAVIDLASGKVMQKIPVEGAVFLNDITVDGKGIVYVSDSGTGIVHRIENGKVSTYLTDIKGVNGLLAAKNDLYILSSDKVQKADASKKLTEVTKLDQGGDGIEPVGNGDFIVSAWVGYINYVSADGKKQLLLDTHDKNKNTADIGFDAAKKIVYVPTFLGKSVVAYQLK